MLSIYDCIKNGRWRPKDYTNDFLLMKVNAFSLKPFFRYCEGTHIQSSKKTGNSFSGTCLFEEGRRAKFSSFVGRGLLT
jgi:hypothetical protein